MISRRNLLIAAGLGSAGAAGLGAGMVEAGVLPGKVRLDRTLGRCGDRPPIPAERAVVRRQGFRSVARGRAVEMVVITPRGAAGRLPVVIAMHGLGGNAGGVLGHAYDRFLARAVDRGVPAFALVGVDGGSTYWHPRASGDDPQKMITHEVLPRLRRLGLGTARIGLMGWSMGGYGALLLGQTLGPERVAAVVASSPAVFLTYRDARSANPHAFDGADDYRRHDVLTGLDRLRSAAIWVDCGRSDPLAPAAERIRAGLRAPAGGIHAGCHDGAYWMRRAPGQLAFLGRHLG